MDRGERFAELFRAEYPGLVRELGLILGDRALAEDVAAEGFVDMQRRIRRRGRRIRRTLVAGVAAIAVAGTAVTAWMVGDRPEGDRSSVFVGERTRPTVPTTTPRWSADELSLRELWRGPGIGGNRFPTFGGELLVPAADALYTSTGFGRRTPEPGGRVAALDRVTGEVRWTTVLGDSAFLQGAAGGTVIANTADGRLVGLAAADGAVRWEISLAALDLGGYGPVRSAVTMRRSAIGLSADRPDDARPPVILGVETDTGEIAWTTTLDEGTDLAWGAPLTHDGAVAFHSWRTDPEVAGEDVAHLVDLADGSIRWTAGLGDGGKPISTSGITDGGYIHLPVPPEVVTIDATTGRRLWDAPGWAVAATDEGLWTVDIDGTLHQRDPATGAVLRTLASPIETPVRLTDLGGGVVGVISLTELAAVDSNGGSRILGEWPEPPEYPVHDRGTLFVALRLEAVVAYDVDAPERVGHGSDASK
ncbi:MAG: PQQ-binding-like beta-propeller repeat protein [Acidimicrobiia bacterium]